MNSTVKYCKEKKGYKEELWEQKVIGMHYNQFYYGRVQGWR